MANTYQLNPVGFEEMVTFVEKTGVVEPSLAVDVTKRFVGEFRVMVHVIGPVP
jgi:hypothetical protein